MSQIKLKATRGRNRISYSEFMTRHESERSEADFSMQCPSVRTGTLSDAMSPPLPLPPLMRELRRHPIFRLLGAAKRENCPDAYNEVLYLWLWRMGVTPPEGVFLEPPGQRGRPRDPKTSIIYDKWIKIGKPPLGRQELARAMFGAKFTIADGAERKRMVDLCGRAVKRHQAQCGLNSA
jgi:hypothetical protein